MVVGNVSDGRVLSSNIRVFPLSIDRQFSDATILPRDRKVSESNMSFLTSMCYDAHANYSTSIPLEVTSTLDGAYGATFKLDGFVNSITPEDNGYSIIFLIKGYTVSVHLSSDYVSTLTSGYLVASLGIYSVDEHSPYLSADDVKIGEGDSANYYFNGVVLTNCESLTGDSILLPACVQWVNANANSTGDVLASALSKISHYYLPIAKVIKSGETVTFEEVVPSRFAIDGGEV